MIFLVEYDDGVQIFEGPFTVFKDDSVPEDCVGVRCWLNVEENISNATSFLLSKTQIPKFSHSQTFGVINIEKLLLIPTLKNL